MSHSHQGHSHNCNASITSSNVYQSLDELEFERGIWYAAQYGDQERVKKLLKNGTQVDVLDAAGYTALHYAARNGHLNVCEILVENGADINARTRSGEATPLHRACSTGKTAVVKFLIEKDAKFDLKDCDGKTALHRAVESQHLEICKFLLKLCPDLNKQTDLKRKLPIDYAKNEELIELLNIS